MGNAAFILFGLTLPREELYSRINQRVDEMIARGLVAEVEALLKKGYSKNLPAMEAIGYKEIIQYLDGVAPKKGDDGHHRLFWEETIASIKQHTRNFAKRQMTWFKRFQGVTWLENQNPEEVCRRVMQQIGLFP
jgi:tRNA dimethylallyltransferase